MCALPLLFGFSSISSASDITQEAPELSETHWTADIPKVVYATRQKQDVTSAPSSVTIITRDMIDALGALNIAEIMRLAPGFQVFYSNGSTFGVTPHGFSGRHPKRLEVKVNGRSVYLPQTSSVAWETLGVLPEDIDHIEVIRGSNVPTYGSNAVLGAINIVTHSPVQQSGGTASITRGSVNTEIISVSQQLQTEQSDILVRAAHKKNTGFLYDDSSKLDHLVISGVHTPGLSDTLEFEFGASRGYFGIGDGDHGDEFVNEYRRSTWVNANWQHLADKQQWKLHFSHADYHFNTPEDLVKISEKYEKDLRGKFPESELTPEQKIAKLFPGHVDEYVQIDPNNASTGDRHFNTTELEIEHQIEQTNWRHVWGLGTRMDKLDDPLQLGGSLETTTYYGFANSEWTPTAKLGINMGLMAEKKDSLDVSTRLAANYHFTEAQHIRTSITRAYRQPALLESDMLKTVRFANGDLIDLVERSAPNVESVKIDTVELGYIGYWFDGQLSVDAKVFYEKLDNEIDFVKAQVTQCDTPIDPVHEKLAQEYCPDFYVDGQYGELIDRKQRVLVHGNTTAWRNHGFELQSKWNIDKHSWLRLHYAYLEGSGGRVRNLHERPYIDEFTSGGQLPRNSGGLLYSYKLDSGYRFSAYWEYIDFINWQSGTPVDSHDRLDITISKQWKTSKGFTELKVTAQNVLNDEYLEFQKNNVFERRAFASLTYHWSD